MAAGSDVELDRARVEVLAAAASGGDAAALNELLGHVAPLVLVRCGRFLPNADDAEEACQEALLTLARRIESFEGQARFTTWMYRVVTNAAIDSYRKLKRRRSVLEEPPDLADRPMQMAGGAVSVVVGARVDILEAADAIDSMYSEPVLLRDLCDLDYDEIGRILAIPEGTAKSRVNKGRGLMRLHLHP